MANRLFIGYSDDTVTDELCHRFRTGNLGKCPDVLVVAPEDGIIGVDKARDIVSHVSVVSVSGAGKVVVIKEAHLATNAFLNAILKVLEDGPGEFVIFSEKDLLPTIHSRCQVMRARETETNAVDAELLKVADALNDGSKKKVYEAFDVLCEKAGVSYYERHTAEEVVTFLGTLGNMFASIARYMADGVKEYSFLEYERLCGWYTMEVLFAAICRCSDDREKIVAKKYSKNDFFEFVRFLAERKEEVPVAMYV